MVKFKKLLLKTKDLEERKDKKTQPKKKIIKATSNLNKVKNVKYNSITEEVEARSLARNKFGEIYKFQRLEKIKPDDNR